jgi:hypothetical protein
VERESQGRIRKLASQRFVPVIRWPNHPLAGGYFKQRPFDPPADRKGRLHNRERGERGLTIVASELTLIPRRSHSSNLLLLEFLP